MYRQGIECSRYMDRVGGREEKERGEVVGGGSGEVKGVRGGGQLFFAVSLLPCQLAPLFGKSCTPGLLPKISPRPPPPSPAHSGQSSIQSHRPDHKERMRKARARGRVIEKARARGRVIVRNNHNEHIYVWTGHGH